MGTIFRAVGPVHRDYRFRLPPGSFGEVITPVPNEGAAGDQQDSTYLEWSLEWDIGGMGNTAILGVNYEVKPVVEPAVDIVSVTAHCRASFISDRSPANAAACTLGFGLHYLILIGEWGGDGVFDLYTQDFPITPDGVIREYSAVFDIADMEVSGYSGDPNPSWETLRTGAAEGLNAQFFFAFADSGEEQVVTDQIRIHEAWFEVNGLAPVITGGPAEVRRRFVYGHAR